MRTASIAMAVAAALCAVSAVLHARDGSYLLAAGVLYLGSTAGFAAFFLWVGTVRAAHRARSSSPPRYVEAGHSRGRQHRGRPRWRH